MPPEEGGGKEGGKKVGGVALIKKQNPHQEVRNKQNKEKHAAANKNNEHEKMKDM